MNCASCGHMNREGAKFCAQCATRLPTACVRCGSELDPAARFCDQCGASVGAAAEVADTAARKVVTILFADLVGSTSFGERVDAESARDAMAGYHAMAQEAIVAAGGTVAKFIGDGVMALFGVPETAEDDAERAVAAGLALQRGFGPIRDRVERRHGAELGLRVGINTGEIVLADGDADLIGDAINTAARLEAACPPGEVLVGEETWRLTRSHVRYEALDEIEVKGKHDPVATYRVVDGEVGDDDLATPFVGRVDELARLRAVFDEATDRGVARLVTVIGAPGVGKTRISREFCESLGDSATVAVLRCERVGTATFAPIADLLRGITSIDDESDPVQVTATLRELVADLDDADRVAELLAGFVGASPARSTEEAFLAVRRLVEAVGRRQPLVVVIDDIQWAEPLFLDLLEHLAEWVHGAPAVLVGLARPELRDLRPSLVEPSRWLAASIALEGLDAAATAELAARLVGADSLPAELVARLPDSTEGNPLFVRELMRMLVDDGVIDQTADGWQLTIDAEAVEVPPTIHSLLAARLDRMSADERRLVELASVVGPEFALGGVAAIADVSDTGELRPTLERLRRRELIESTGNYWGDEPIYRFHHVLIRDAAYRRLLKRARADLHVRVGEWTERTAADLPGEHQVAIAYHYEQAHEYRRQLDDPAEEIADVGRRAAELLGAAAEQSLGRDDLAAASTLAERALARLAEGDPRIPALLVVAAEALMALGDVTGGRPVVERLSQVAGDDVRLAPWAECFVAQLLMLTEPDRLHDAEQTAGRAATRLAELGDEAGVAKARLVRAGVLARLGQVGQCEAELDLALAAARSAGDRRRVAAVLGAAPVAALWGPSPIQRAGGRCLDVIRLLRITTGSPAVEATSVRCQAVLEALRGRFDTARSMLAQSRTTVEELGLRHGVAETDLYTGIVELLAGEPSVAEPALRAAYRDLELLGIGAEAGQAAAYLARAVLRQGRLDEANQLAARSAELAGENPQTAITARAVQAEILAAQGDLGAAVAAAAEAVARAEGTDIIVDHANASAVLARVSRMAGDDVGADRAESVARALYEQKAATVDLLIGGAPSAPVKAVPEQRSASNGGSNTTRLDGIDEAVAPIDHQPWNEADRLSRRLLRDLVDGDVDAVVAAIDEDIEFHERQPHVQISHLGRDAVAAGGAPALFLLGTNLLADVETIATRGEHLVLEFFRLRIDGDASGPAIELLIVDRWNDGGRNDYSVTFSPDQLAEAIAELERLYLEQLGSSIEAVHVRELGRGMALLSAGDLDGFIDLHDPSLVMRDHRQIGWPELQLDEYRQRVGSIAAVAADAIVFHERVLRLDHTSSVCGAQRIVFTTVGGPQQVSRSVILMIMDPYTGLITLMEQFEEDQVDEAVARFDELMAGRGAVLHNAASRRGSFLNIWLRRGDDALVADAIVADATFIDEHGEPFEPAAFDRREVMAVGGDRLALVQLSGPEHVFAVEEFDDEGKLVAVRRFAPDGMTDATAHLDRRWLEIEGETLQVDRAGQLARPARRLENAATRHRDAYVAEGGGPEAFSEDYVFEDRRFVVSAGHTDSDEFIAGMDFFGDRDAEITLTTQAIRGDRFSLFTVETRVGDFVIEQLMFNELAEDGRLRRNVVFDTDDIHAALAELDRSWATTVPDSHRHVLRVAGRYVQAVWNEDAEVDAALVSDDFVGFDHRSLGFDPTGRDHWVQHRRQRFDEGTTKILVPEILYLSEHVMAISVLFLVTTDSGSEWEEQINAVIVVGGEMIVREEVFDEDERDAAVRRAEQLEAERGAVSTSGVANAATRIAGHLITLANDGARVADLIADDFRRDDRRRHLSFPDHGRDELIRLFEANARLGARHTFDHIAVRGERLALSELRTSFDDGESVVEMLTLVEFDAEGRMLVETNFETDRLIDALDELDQRWTATLDPADAETYRIATAHYAAYVALDGERLDDLTAESYVFVDHRRLGNFGELDRTGFFEMFESRRATRGAGTTRSVAVHRLADGVLVWSTEEHTSRDGSGGDTASSGVFLMCVAEGRAVRGEIWDSGQIEAALARAGELAI